jgi:hypothetical protein
MRLYEIEMRELLETELRDDPVRKEMKINT